MEKLRARVNKKEAFDRKMKKNSIEFMVILAAEYVINTRN